MDINDIQGVGIVIDDEVDDARANINQITSQLKSAYIPYLAFKELPDDRLIKHFHGASFLILDWNLHGQDPSAEGSPVLPKELKDQHIASSIEFIKHIKENCLLPIFILTNDVPSEIENTLKSNGLITDDGINFIFVKSKVDVVKNNLLETILDWIKENPSIYVMNEWEKEYYTAKNKLFSEFYSLSPAWPKVLWDTYKDDGVNESLVIGDLISRNLHTRMAPFQFDSDVVNECKYVANKDETRKVIEGERFIQSSGLDINSISTGDLFKIDRKFYINIRPDCDCIPDRSGQEKSLDDVELYLLKGMPLSDQNEKDNYDDTFGFLRDPDNQFSVFGMYNNKSIQFKFKKIYVKKWSELKEKRRGRLLPPYLTQLQQKYSHYLQRQGLPRIPAIAVYDPPD